MKLKPAARLSSRRSRLAALAAAGTTVLTIAALTVAQPAHADPTFVYAAVGSDTTQEVMNTFAADLGSNQLGSWDAVNPVTQTPDEVISYTDGKSGANCSYTRPNGSTDGKDAFRKSINPSTFAPRYAPDQPQPNCIDIDRSFTGPGSDASNTGALVWIPFALDEVTGATGPAGTTKITTANLFTLTDLKILYATGGTVTEGGVTYNPQTATGSQVQINLYLPQPTGGLGYGSGLLAFWVSTLGIPDPMPAWDHQTIVAGPNAGTQVEQNDGLATTDPNGYMPFSIAQWIAQSNGIDDRRHGAVLQNINGIFPCAGNSNCSPSGGTPNTTLFPIPAEVYNIVQYDQVVNTGDGHFDINLADMLAGTGSALCQDQFTITGHGFAVLPGEPLSDPCGSTFNLLRGFDPITDPV